MNFAINDEFSLTCYVQWSAALIILLINVNAVLNEIFNKIKSVKCSCIVDQLALRFVVSFEAQTAALTCVRKILAILLSSTSRYKLIQEVLKLVAPNDLPDIGLDLLVIQALLFILQVCDAVLLEYACLFRQLGAF